MRWGDAVGGAVERLARALFGAFDEDGGWRSVVFPWLLHTLLRRSRPLYRLLMQQCRLRATGVVGFHFFTALAAARASGIEEGNVDEWCVCLERR